MKKIYSHFQSKSTDKNNKYTMIHIPNTMELFNTPEDNFFQMVRDFLKEETARQLEATEVFTDFAPVENEREDDASDTTSVSSE